MSRRNPMNAGRCERWSPSKQKTCGRSARYVVFETRCLCKSCYAVFQRNKGRIELVYYEAPTVAEKWEFRQRLSRELDGPQVKEQRAALRASLKALVQAELEEAQAQHEQHN